VVHRYQRRALAHARALLGSDGDAADMVQAAFLDAFTQLARFDEAREFYAWFYVILRNRCFKQWARSGNRGWDEASENIAPPALTPAEQIYDLRQALNRLAPGDREILVLKHLDGWTYDELAERLAIPRGTVMSRLFHARRRLKQLLCELPGENT
jgi:RNA polymerase sigma-70 factor (ECF subfamily)